MAWRPRVRTGRGATGGRIHRNGNAINQTEAVAGTPVIIDLQGVSRPVNVVITRGAGDTLLYATTTDAAALLDADHPAWTIEQASIVANRVELVTSAGTKGILVQRVSGSSSDSSVWAWAIFRGPGEAPYNPVYDPNYDVAPESEIDYLRFARQAGFGAIPGEETSAISSGDTFGEMLTAYESGSWDYMPGGVPMLPDNTNTSWDNNQRRSLAASVLWRGAFTPNQSNRFIWKAAWVASKIYCVGEILGETRSYVWETHFNKMADIISSGGTIRDMMEYLVYGAPAARFLDNISNNGRDPATGFTDREPNQNFVRELAQLYTHGQYRMDLSGNLLRDGSGNLIPIYNTDDILNMARLFSGLITSVNAWSMTLILSGSQHYRGPCNVPYLGITTPGYADHPAAPPAVGTQGVAGANPHGHIKACLDAMFAIDETLVYTALHFIRHYVTDNPSPNYVRRVVAALQDNGSGVRGQYLAMIRAILLDEEARGTSKPAAFGRALDFALPAFAAHRVAQQRFRVEQGHVVTGDATNGSAVITNISPPDTLEWLAANGSNQFRISGTGVPANATMTRNSATQITLSTNFTGSTGPVTLTIDRIPAPLLSEVWEHTASWQSGQSNNGVGRIPVEVGRPPSVFSDFDQVTGFIDTNVYGGAVGMWSTSAILSFFLTMIGGAHHRPPTSSYGGIAPVRMGMWDLDWMANGSPTNTQLVERAEYMLLTGRTIEPVAKTKLVEMLDGLMTADAATFGAPDNTLKLKRRAAYAIGGVLLQPESMEQK